MSTAVVLKPGVATHLCVAKILQCVAKNITNQKQSITADTLKVFAEGDLLIVIIGLMFSVSRCPKVITLSGFS
jgi:hypothetical protein